jgi:hypothetical protein
MQAEKRTIVDLYFFFDFFFREGDGHRSAEFLISAEANFGSRAPPEFAEI